MPEHFIEHEALTLAMEDAEADSGNHEPLEDYLRKNFLRGEVRNLQFAAQILADSCRRVANDTRWQPSL